MKQQSFAAWAIIALSGLSVLGSPPKTEQGTNKNPAADSAAKAGEQRSSWKNADHMLASCVAIDNQEEVAVARFAEKKLTNTAAKDFAKMLIADHTAYLRKLEHFAPEATHDGFLTVERSPTRLDADRDAANQPKPGAIQRTAAKPNLGTQDAATIDMLQLHRELAEQCLADTQEMMNGKKGLEYDECFVGMQIAKHAAMKTKLEVFQRHASSELKELFAQGLTTTTSHLERAEELMEQLAHESSKATATK